jgi:hypothetical protein
MKFSIKLSSIFSNHKDRFVIEPTHSLKKASLRPAMSFQRGAKE